MLQHTRLFLLNNIKSQKSVNFNPPSFQIVKRNNYHSHSYNSGSAQQHRNFKTPFNVYRFSISDSFENAIRYFNANSEGPKEDNSKNDKKQANNNNNNSNNSNNKEDKNEKEKEKKAEDNNENKGEDNRKEDEEKKKDKEETKKEKKDDGEDQLFENEEVKKMVEDHLSSILIVLFTILIVLFYWTMSSKHQKSWKDLKSELASRSVFIYPPFPFITLSSLFI